MYDKYSALVVLARATLWVNSTFLVHTRMLMYNVMYDKYSALVALARASLAVAVHF